MNIFSVFRPTDGGIEAYNQLQGIKKKTVQFRTFVLKCIQITIFYRPQVSLHYPRSWADCWRYAMNIRNEIAC